MLPPPSGFSPRLFRPPVTYTYCAGRALRDLGIDTRRPHSQPIVFMRTVRSGKRGKAMVLLTLVIGVLNVCLGYALAVHLGYGPPSLLDAWDAMSGHQPVVEPSIEPVEEPAPEAVQSEPDTFDDFVPELSGETPLSDEFDEYEPLGPAESEAWNLNEKFVETSVLKFNIVLIKTGNRLADIDTRLRSLEGEFSLEDAQENLSKLETACQSHLKELNQVSDEFRTRFDELQGLDTLAEDVDMVILEESAQIETTVSNLQHMDFESNLPAARARLLEEIHKLRAAGRKLRGYLDVVFLTIARSENRLGQIEKRLQLDQLTKLTNRIGFEVMLHRWWDENRHKSRQISAALFDLDGFGKINEIYGALIGDRILYKLGQFIVEESGKEATTARYGGQSFAVVTLDIGPRQAIKTFEHIRQSIKIITFIHGKERIQLTVCEGVTEATPEDTSEVVSQRLEEALKKAKQAGTNQSFVHDGTAAKPIESPPLKVEFRDILI